MCYKKFILPGCFFISLIACNNGNTNLKNNIDTTAKQTDKRLPPVETQKPNSSYKPAFAGQTRINAVKTTTAINVEKIASKLGEPWAIIPFTGNRLLVTDKTGFMQIVSEEGTVLKKITGFPQVDNRAQGGMLDVALDPSFAQNKTIYWAFFRTTKKSWQPYRYCQRHNK